MLSDNLSEDSSKVQHRVVSYPIIPKRIYLQEREEHLMLSIMPKCETTEKVRRDLRDRIVKLKTNQLVQRHGFNELYIQEHPNVT